MKFKANHDLVLPNGGFVKAGQTFGYDGDVSSFASVIEPVTEAPKTAKTKKSDKKPVTEAE